MPSLRPWTKIAGTRDSLPVARIASMPSSMRCARACCKPARGAPVTASWAGSRANAGRARRRDSGLESSRDPLLVRLSQALLIRAMPEVGGMPLLVPKMGRPRSSPHAASALRPVRPPFSREAVSAQIVEHAEAAVSVGVSDRNRLRDLANQ